MELSSFGKMLNSLYSDKMSVLRYKEVLNEDTTVSVEELETPVYTDIPCRISFTSTDNPETTKEDSNPVYLQLKVFCSAEIDVQKGDKIVVQRIKNGSVIATYKGTANLPLQFVTHKEILLVQVGDA